jgi:hypothetical protein
MQKSNLINIFKTFSKKELRDFKKWLQSPLHNQREDVLKLFNYLSEEANLIDDVVPGLNRSGGLLYP